MNEEEKKAFLAEVAEHNEKGTVRALSAEEKEIIIENRKYKGENLERYNKILEATMDIVKNNSYCLQILRSANYQEIKESSRKPDGFDDCGFYLQDVYIGNREGGPQGHITKEAYFHKEAGYSPQNGTHDVIYIGCYSMQLICNLADKCGKTDEERNEIASYMLLNLVTHEASHGNQINRGPWPVQISRNEDTKYDIISYYRDLYAKTLAIDEIAEYERQTEGFTRYDEELLKTHKKTREMCVKGLGGVLSKEDEKEIKKLCEKYKTIYKEGGAISQGRQLSSEQVAVGYLNEALNEAGVMADSWVALLSVGNNEVHKTARESWGEFMYKQRMSESGYGILSLDDKKYNEMFGTDTPEAEAIRQSYARSIFKDITQTKFAQYMSEKLELKSEYLPKIETELNRTEILFALTSAYDPRSMGSIDKFIAEALPENSLTEENKKKLTLLIKHPELCEVLQYKDNIFKKDERITDEARDLALSYFVEHEDKIEGFLGCMKDREQKTPYANQPVKISNPMFFRMGGIDI